MEFPTVGDIIGLALKEPVTTAKRLFLDPSFTPAVSKIVLLAELFICLLIVKVVPYTEIDWGAYMDEVEGVVNGTYDYALLKGDTGPLVYPAGFVWFFQAMYYATDLGKNILRAQYIFVAFYLINLAVVHQLYLRSKLPIKPYVLIMMSVASYRMHSIFVLRLFNDPVALFFCFAAMNAILSKRWLLGSLLYTIAVSIKMNVLLFAPGLGMMMLVTSGIWGTLPKLAICAGFQVVVALPFLQENWFNYLAGSVELTRQFKYKWSVNWKCLEFFFPDESLTQARVVELDEILYKSDELPGAIDLFLNRKFHACLATLHISLLVYFIFQQWVKPEGGLWKVLTRARIPNFGGQPSAERLISVMFTSNFLGVMFFRSLHVQFYSWYYYTLPYLLWTTDLPEVLKVALLLGIEWGWNVPAPLTDPPELAYPGTPTSSAVLHLCHVVVLCALLARAVAGPKKEKV